MELGALLLIRRSKVRILHDPPSKPLQGAVLGRKAVSEIPKTTKV